MRNIVTMGSAALCAAILTTTAGAAQAGTTILYETFGNVLYSMDLQSQTQLGVHNGNAANLTAANGHIYWQDGVKIVGANADLTGAQTIWTNLDAPTDFTIDGPSPAVPELSTWTMLLLGFAGLGLAAHRKSTARQTALVA